jgi:hypothetical protein
MKIGPTFACSITYNPSHMGSPSFERLFALREKFVALVDSRYP